MWYIFACQISPICDLGTSAGIRGFANSPNSGLMTFITLFLIILKHLEGLTNCTKNYTIFFMDKHEYHYVYDAMIMRAVGQSCLLLHHTAPIFSNLLHVAVIGSNKLKLAVAKNGWLQSHPEKTIIHDLAGIVMTTFIVSLVILNCRGY